MTNETELRNRIADVIYESFGNRNHPWVDFISNPHEDGAFKAEGEFDPKVFAQAIIDEFWLEVVSGGGRPGQRQQIVGRWEQQ